MAPITVERAAPTIRQRQARAVARAAAVALMLFSAVVFLQFLSGAFTSEFGAYPDEASHYLSGLLVHDYLASGFDSSPMVFAKNFYLHYPYLAIGHWPPFFYLVEGIWMLPFSGSRVSVLLLMAVITTVTATTIWQFLKDQAGFAAALLMSGWFVAVPLVQTYTSMVMLDSLLGLLSIWAAIRFGRFAKSGRLKDGLWFSVFAALAILTKGNGLDLVFVPPIALLLTGNYKLMRKPALWVSGALVAVCTLPWHLVTRNLMLPTFLFHPGPDFTLAAIGFYGTALLRGVGVGALLLAGLGVWERLIKPYRTGGVDPCWAAVGALLVSVVGFHCVVPGGLEVRYLVPAIPPLILFIAAGTVWVGGHLPRLPFTQTGRYAALAVLAILIFAGEAFRIPTKRQYGFNKVADRIASLPNFDQSVTLVSSETTVGEGMLVAEIAMRGSRPGPTVLRASKILADSDWNVTTYRPLFDSATALGECMSKLPLRYLVIDGSPARIPYAHHQQILAVLRAQSQRWHLVGKYVENGTAIWVYSAAVDQSADSLQPVALVNMDWRGSNTKWPVSMRLACSSEGETIRGTRSNQPQ